jgi:hypothetical protein
MMCGKDGLDVYLQQVTRAHTGHSFLKKDIISRLELRMIEFVTIMKQYPS